MKHIVAIVSATLAIYAVLAAIIIMGIVFGLNAAIYAITLTVGAAGVVSYFTERD